MQATFHHPVTRETIPQKLKERKPKEFQPRMLGTMTPRTDPEVVYRSTIYKETVQ